MYMCTDRWSLLACQACHILEANVHALPVAFCSCEAWPPAPQVRQSCSKP